MKSIMHHGLSDQFWFICDASYTSLEVMVSVHCTVAFGFYACLFDSQKE
jgi:hypothetical protein